MMRTKTMTIATRKRVRVSKVAVRLRLWGVDKRTV
jgi:hypothetical protein